MSDYRSTCPKRTTIFGHSWEAIQRAQQGGSLQERIKPDDTNPSLTPADLALIEKYGIEGLAEAGYFGTLDKVKRLNL